MLLVFCAGLLLQVFRLAVELIALAADLDDVSVVQQPIQHRRGSQAQRRGPALKVPAERDTELFCLPLAIGQSQVPIGRAAEAMLP